MGQSKQLFFEKPVFEGVTKNFIPMIKIYTISMALLISTVLSFQVKSQISLTESDASSPGESYPVVHDTTNLESIDTGTVGASQNWNYSVLSSDENDTINYLDPASTPAGGDFLSSNLATPYSGGFIYLTKTSQEIDIIGLTYDTLSIHLSDPVIYMQFPTDQNTSYSDVGTATVTVPYDTSILGQTVDSVRLRRDILLDFQTQGWGTLTTPLNTYDNTLKVNRHEIDIDSIWIHVVTFLGSQWQFYQAQNDTVDYYSWYTNQIGNPLLEITYKYDTVRSVYFLNDPQQQTNIQAEEKTTEFNIFPNPSSGEFNFTWNSNVVSKIKIYNAVGKLLLNKDIQRLNTFEWQPQQDGIYFVFFYDNENNLISKEKLIKTK